MLLGIHIHNYFSCVIFFFFYLFTNIAHSQVNPLIFDISGSWKLDQTTIKNRWMPDELVRCQSLFAEANFPMYGRDRMQLNFERSERVRNLNNNYLRYYYTGNYIHHHGYADRDQILNESNQIDSYSYDYDCHIETIVYDIAGYIEYNWEFNIMGLDLQGVSSQSPIYEHGTSIRIRQFWERNVFSSALFDSTIADAMKLHITFSDEQFTVFGMPDGCDIDLGEGRPSSISLTSCSIQSYYPLRYSKQDGAFNALNEQGTLLVKLYLNTVNPIPVENASIELRKQKFGFRERRTDESLKDYIEFADTHSVVIARQSLSPESINGNMSEVYFSNLDVFHQSTVTGNTSIHPAYYYVKVLTPSTTVGGVGTLYLMENQSLNHSILPNETTTTNIPLEALEEIGMKLDVISLLSDISDINYKPIEDRMKEYLERVQNDPSLQSGEKIEGIKRSIDAERAINDAAYWSDNMLTFMLTGFGNLIADLYGELDFTRRDLTNTRERLNASGLENRTLVEEYSEMFGITGNTSTPTLRDMAEPVFQSDEASMIQQSLSSFCTLLLTELQLAGVTSDDAKKICDNINTVMGMILSAVQSKTLSGATQAQIQRLIQELINFSHPVLFDNNVKIEQFDLVKNLLGLDLSVGGIIDHASTTTIDFEDFEVNFSSVISYGSLTKDSLEFSVDHAMNWNRDDIQNYLADKQLVSNLITELNEDAVDTDNLLRIELALANSFGSASDVLGFIGEIVPNKYTEFFSKLTKVLKYLSNGSATISSYKFIYGRAPTYAEDAAYLAMDETPPSRLESQTAKSTPPFTNSSVKPTQQTSSINPALFNQLSVESRNVESNLGQLGTLLNNNNIGGLMNELLLDNPDSYRKALKDYQSILNKIGILISTVDVTSPDIPDKERFNQVPFVRMRFEQQQAEMYRELSDIILAVITPEFKSHTDPAYLAQKNHVLYLIQSLRSVLQDYTDEIFIGSFALRNLALNPSIDIQLDSPLSVETGEPIINQKDEQFTLKAYISNLNTLPIENLGLKLQILSPNNSLQVLNEDVIFIGLLSGDDGLFKVGDDEAEVEWTLQYDGDLSAENIVLKVTALENGEIPMQFHSSPAHSLLIVEPSLGDSDLDGMPNSYEEENGFNLTLNDSLDDEDQDGLSNIEELRLGTIPTNPDTDQDGRFDGDEVLGINGKTSNPFEKDSDFDGQIDSIDGEPLDGSISEQFFVHKDSEIGVGATEIELTEKNPVAVVQIVNTGKQPLLWTAYSENEAVAVVSPKYPNVGNDSNPLIVAAPLFYDFRSNINTETRIVIVDSGGTNKDKRIITVKVGDEIDLDQTNQIPIAVEDFASVEQGEIIYIDVLSNDEDLDADEIYLTGVSQPIHGVTSINKDGTIFFRSNTSYLGQDVFQYSIRDSNRNINSGTVTVDVTKNAQIKYWQLH